MHFVNAVHAVYVGFVPEFIIALAHFTFPSHSLATLT